MPVLAFVLVAVFFAAGAFLVVVVFLAAVVFFAAGAFLVAAVFLAAGAFLAAAGLSVFFAAGLSAVLVAASFTGPEVPVGDGEVSKMQTNS